MHGVNLDLLRTAPRDPHAQHRAEHLATLREARRQRWLAFAARMTEALRRAGHAMAPGLSARDARR